MVSHDRLSRVRLRLHLRIASPPAARTAARGTDHRSRHRLPAVPPRQPGGRPGSMTCPAPDPGRWSPDWSRTAHHRPRSPTAPRFRTLVRRAERPVRDRGHGGEPVPSEGPGAVRLCLGERPGALSAGVGHVHRRGRSADGDRHAVVVDRDSCRLYETWDTRPGSPRWRAGSGATWDLRSNRLRPRVDLGRRCGSADPARTPHL